MSTTLAPQPIAELCRDAVRRLNIDATAFATTLSRIDALTESLDEAHPRLPVPTRHRLEDLAVEYTITALCAERLELKGGETTGRLNPTLKEANSCRSRLRQIATSIESLIKENPKIEGRTFRKPTAEEFGPELCQPPAPVKIVEKAHHEPLLGGLARQPKPVHPAPLTSKEPSPLAWTPTIIDLHASHNSQRPAPGLQSPAAPPMNRAQRRVAERDRARNERKAKKRMKLEAPQFATG